MGNQVLNSLTKITLIDEMDFFLNVYQRPTHILTEQSKQKLHKNYCQPGFDRLSM